MFSFFKSEDQAISVEFAPMFDGLAEVCPPQSAIKFIPQWYKDMAVRIEGLKDEDLPLHQRGKASGKTLKACPAIVDHLRAGYVIPAWTDFSIKVGADGLFDWYTANERYEISFHGPQQLVPEATKEDELNYVVKFVSPWKIRMPKGTFMMMKSLPYHTQLPFRVAEGIIDASVTSTTNINTFWPKKEGEYFIPRGAPLAMLVPFKKTAFELRVHSSAETGRKWDESNRTLIFDTFENTYRNLTDRFIHKLYK